jgi:hypothetical protein
MQCPDTFALVTRRLSAYNLLLLIMCCRDMRVAVDASMHRMASLISIPMWTSRGMQEYKEYTKEVILASTALRTSCCATVSCCDLRG